MPLKKISDAKMGGMVLLTIRGMKILNPTPLLYFQEQRKRLRDVKIFENVGHGIETYSEAIAFIQKKDSDFIGLHRLAL